MCRLRMRISRYVHGIQLSRMTTWLGVVMRRILRPLRVPCLAVIIALVVSSCYGSRDMSNNDKIWSYDN